MGEEKGERERGWMAVGGRLEVVEVDDDDDEHEHHRSQLL